jgi:DegV family protein with EDD domain
VSHSRTVQIGKKRQDFHFFGPTGTLEAPMKRTAFVADTTIGLSPSEAEARGIHLVPVQVIVDGVPYRDLFEFTPEALRRAQLEGKRISTSQVNPADFETLYSSLLERFDQVISVHMSSKLSGTYATAKLIAARFADRVCPIDSHSLNAGLDYVLEGVRQAVDAGVPNHLLETSIGPLRDQVRGLVLPKSLDGLLRSGRIGGLQHFVGTLLRLVPVLLLEDGLVRPLDRARGFQAALERCVEDFRRLYPHGARVTLAHAENLPVVETLQTLLRKEGVILEGVREAGAAVSAHTGPGTVAVFAAPLT